MAKGDLRQALRIFREICEWSASAQRAHLDAHCPDAAVRAEVEALLRSDKREDPFLDATSPGRELDPLAAVAIESEADASLPTRIGRYEILGKIGEGGMGVIYEALQDSPRRRVALKVIQPGPESRALLRRFQREVQVLGQLQHPGIAGIHEAGLAEGAHGRQPFFAMERIDGLPLDRHVREAELTTPQRLELLARVADAVQHAHQKGVIHRDLKPANVLVVRSASEADTDPNAGSGTFVSDAIGFPKILDFGIARVIDAEMQPGTLQTEAGQLIGTLAYMSPEQVVGHSNQLDTRCDVYALGVMLYEALCGQRPFDFSECSVPEAARRIREETPVGVETLNPGLRGDIATIVAKAMEKERERRYGSCAEFAADIRRYLGNEPIEARPATTFYVLGRFARRNKAIVALLTGTVLMLIVALIASAYGLVQAEERRLAAVASNERLQAVVDYQAEMLKGVDIEEMGRGIIADLRTEAIRLTEENPDAGDQLAHFESLVARMNPATIAARSLDRSILSRAITTLDEQFTEQPEVQTELRHSVVGILHQIGLPAGSLQQARQALQEHEATFGSDHPATLQIQHDMLDLFLEVAALDEAVKLGERTLAARRRVLGADHLDTLATQAKFGEVLTTASRPEQAREVLEDAVRRLRDKVGIIHSATMTAEKALAAHLVAQRELDPALEIYLAILEQQEETLPADADEALATVLSLATLYFHRKEPQQALPLLERYASSMTDRYGTDHPSTLRARSQLAETLIVLNELEQAEPILHDTLERQRRVMGADHPSRAGTLRAAVRLALRRQDYPSAKRYAREAFESAERSVGMDSLRTLAALSDLGTVNLKALDYPAAIQFAREAMDGFERVLGPGHQRTLGMRQNYAKALLAAGEAEQAASVLVPLVATCRVEFPESSMFAGVLGHTVNALIAVGRPDEAVPLAKDLIAWLQQRDFSGPSFARAYVWLGRAEYAAGDFEACARTLETAYETLEPFPELWPTTACQLLQHALGVRDGQEAALRAAQDALIRLEAQMASFNAEIRTPVLVQLRSVVGDLSQSDAQPE